MKKETIYRSNDGDITLKPDGDGLYWFEFGNIQGSLSREDLTDLVCFFVELEKENI